MAAEDATVPLDETFRDTVEYCGRTFQKYSLANGTYFSPADEEEADRLELTHNVLCRVFDDRLIFPPMRSPKKILDCGCGAGNWAVDVAEQYPESEVLGIDVSPFMLPEDPPSNLEFQIDDLNGSFTFPPNEFDLVHSQMLAGGIHASRWQSYVNDIFRVLKPGGWCQMIELYLNAQSDNGTLADGEQFQTLEENVRLTSREFVIDHALSKWSRQYLRALHPLKDPRAALNLANWMRRAGFTDIESRLITLPMSGWSSDVRDNSIGRANRDNISEMLSTIALYPFTKQQRMPMDEFERLIDGAREEAGRVSLKAYFPLYVFIGRKPVVGALQSGG
ncbi:hypothetical protein K4F52_000164 [Lecanicillium sp. MT-2017a]|nr:hypothetical protein K4F52_000164 [Lecanicillium sp. MT-2017a]